MTTTIVIIFKVYKLDEELYIVRLKSGEIEDGIMFGNKPIIPVNTTERMARHDEKNAAK